MLHLCTGFTDSHHLPGTRKQRHCDARLKLETLAHLVAFKTRADYSMDPFRALGFPPPFLRCLTDPFGNNVATAAGWLASRLPCTTASASPSWPATTGVTPGSKLSSRRHKRTGPIQTCRYAPHQRCCPIGLLLGFHAKSLPLSRSCALPNLPLAGMMLFPVLWVVCGSTISPKARQYAEWGVQHGWNLIKIVFSSPPQAASVLFSFNKHKPHPARHICHAVFVRDKTSGREPLGVVCPLWSPALGSEFSINCIELERTCRQFGDSFRRLVSLGSLRVGSLEGRGNLGFGSFCLPRKLPTVHSLSQLFDRWRYRWCTLRFEVRLLLPDAGNINPKPRRAETVRTGLRQPGWKNSGKAHPHRC